MSDTIVASLITASVGLIGVALGVFKDQLLGFFKTTKRNITGEWVGQAEDVEVRGIIEYEIKRVYAVRANLKQTGNTIIGSASSDAADMHSTHHLVGKFVSDEIIEFNYKMKLEGSIHTGKILFRLNGLGNELSGYFLAKRAKETGMVFGVIKLTKINT